MHEIIKQQSMTEPIRSSSHQGWYDINLSLRLFTLLALAMQVDVSVAAVARSDHGDDESITVDSTPLVDEEQLIVDEVSEIEDLSLLITVLVGFSIGYFVSLILSSFNASSDDADESTADESTADESTAAASLSINEQLAAISTSSNGLGDVGDAINPLDSEVVISKVTTEVIELVTEPSEETIQEPIIEPMTPKIYLSAMQSDGNENIAEIEKTFLNAAVEFDSVEANNVAPSIVNVSYLIDDYALGDVIALKFTIVDPDSHQFVLLADWIETVEIKEESAGNYEVNITARVNKNYFYKNEQMINKTNAGYEVGLSMAFSDGESHQQLISPIDMAVSDASLAPIFSAFSHTETLSNDGQYTLNGFIDDELDNITVSSTAADQDNDAILTGTPELVTGDLVFSLKSDLSYLTDIVTIVSPFGHSMQFPISSGYLQSVFSAPDITLTVDPTDAVECSVPVKNLLEFGNQFRLISSTNNQASNEFGAGQGEYVISISSGNNTVNIPGALTSDDSSSLPFWTNQYYYDLYDFTIESSADDLSSSLLNISVDGVEQFQLALDSEETLDIKMLVRSDQLESSTLERPFLELAMEKSDIIIGSDPLFYKQANLQYSKIPEVWQQGYTGKEIVSAVVELPFDSAHYDLSGNYLSEPSQQGSHDAHSTNTAGVMAAVGANGQGLIGVAPESSLISISQVLTESLFEIDDLRVLNNSWGPEDSNGTVDKMLAKDEAVIEKAVTEHNMAVVFANGNGGSTAESSNYDGYANSIYTIAAQSINALGRGLGFIEQGSNITASFYADAMYYNPFEDGIVTTSPNDTISDSFSGTSAAAPMASGIICLMLEANPQLDWRDIVNIFAHVAINNDPLDSGWAVNRAGVDYNHKYGFGAILADAAVKAAKDPDYKIAGEMLEDDFTETAFLNQQYLIEQNANLKVEFVTVTLDIPGFFNDQENLNISLIHQDYVDSTLETRSQLASTHELALGKSLSYDEWEFSSVVHWGEDLNGSWSLEVTDENNDAVNTDNWSWDLDIFYHEMI